MTAVILDRNGVIDKNRLGHVKRWDEFRFLPGAPEAVARLTRSQVQAVVITDRATPNRRVVPVDVVEDVHRRMRSEIEAPGGHIVDIAYCPHPPGQGSWLSKFGHAEHPSTVAADLPAAVDLVLTGQVKHMQVSGSG